MKRISESGLIFAELTFILLDPSRPESDATRGRGGGAARLGFPCRECDRFTAHSNRHLTGCSMQAWWETSICFSTTQRTGIPQRLRCGSLADLFTFCCGM